MNDYIKSLINKDGGFLQTTRIDVSQLQESFVYDHVSVKGLPLIISGFQKSNIHSQNISNNCINNNINFNNYNCNFNKNNINSNNTTINHENNLFTLKWLRENSNKLDEILYPESGWNLSRYIDHLNGDQTYSPSIPEHQLYTNTLSSSPLTNSPHVPSTPNSQISTPNMMSVSSNSIKPPSTRSKKSLDCPSEWSNYLNDTATSLIPNYLMERRSHDLVSNLPSELRIGSSMKFYIDGDDYWSPGQRESCASIYQSLIVYGNSNTTTYWFCTDSESRERATHFWNSKLRSGSVLESEENGLIIPINDLLCSGVKFYIIEQKLGDMVVLPSCCVYQCLNIGGNSIKVSWQRVTPHSMSLCYDYIIPIYRTIKKQEIYPAKLIAFYTLKNYILMAKELLLKPDVSVDQVIRFIRETLMIHRVLVDMNWNEKIFNEDSRLKKPVRPKQFNCGENVLTNFCSICSTHLFNRSYQCSQCTNPDLTSNNIPSATTPLANQPQQQLINHLDYCLNCIADGKDQKHSNQIELTQIFTPSNIEDLLGQSKSVLKDILIKYNLFESNDVFEECFTSMISPYIVSIATIAFNQVTLSNVDTKSTCHQCKLTKPMSKMAYCSGSSPTSTNCNKKYCSQCLWNRYQLSLVECQKSLNWQCLFCQGICNCCACVKKKNIAVNIPNSPRKRDCHDLYNVTSPLTSPTVPYDCYVNNNPFIYNSKSSTAIWTQHQMPKHLSNNSALYCAPTAIGFSTSSNLIYNSQHIQQQQQLSSSTSNTNITSSGSNNNIQVMPVKVEYTNQSNQLQHLFQQLNNPPLTPKSHSLPSTPLSHSQPIYPFYLYSNNSLNSSDELHSEQSSPYIYQNSPINTPFVTPLQISQTLHYVKSNNTPLSSPDRNLNITQRSLTEIPKLSSSSPSISSPSQTSESLNMTTTTTNNQSKTTISVKSEDINTIASTTSIETDSKNKKATNNNKKRRTDESSSKSTGTGKGRSGNKKSSPPTITSSDSRSKLLSSSGGNWFDQKVPSDQTTFSPPVSTNTANTISNSSSVVVPASTSVVNQTPNPIASSQTTSIYIPGTVVWARLGGLSHFFPAKIAFPDEIPSTGVRYPPEYATYLFFFGDNYFDWVQNKNIIPFITGNEFDYLQTPAFNLAIKDAHEYKRNCLLPQQQQLQQQQLQQPQLIQNVYSYPDTSVMQNYQPVNDFQQLQQQQQQQNSFSNNVGLPSGNNTYMDNHQLSDPYHIANSGDGNASNMMAGSTSCQPTLPDTSIDPHQHHQPQLQQQTHHNMLQESSTGVTNASHFLSTMSLQSTGSLEQFFVPNDNSNTNTNSNVNANQTQQNQMQQQQQAQQQPTNTYNNTMPIVKPEPSADEQHQYDMYSAQYTSTTAPHSSSTTTTSSDPSNSGNYNNYQNPIVCIDELKNGENSGTDSPKSQFISEPNTDVFFENTWWNNLQL